MVKEQFGKILDLGIIFPSNSNWASLLLFQNMAGLGMLLGITELLTLSLDQSIILFHTYTVLQQLFRKKYV